jgi:hypothetical protein
MCASAYSHARRTGHVLSYSCSALDVRLLNGDETLAGCLHQSGMHDATVLSPVCVCVCSPTCRRAQGAGGCSNPAGQGQARVVRWQQHVRPGHGRGRCCCWCRGARVHAPDCLQGADSCLLGPRGTSQVGGIAGEQYLLCTSSLCSGQLAGQVAGSGTCSIPMFHWVAGVTHSHAARKLDQEARNRCMLAVSAWFWSSDSPCYIRNDASRGTRMSGANDAPKLYCATLHFIALVLPRLQ